MKRSIHETQRNKWAEKAQKTGMHPVKQLPEWWACLPTGEKEVIRGVLGMLRGARKGPNPEVARAAAVWERRLGCFIKVRLVNGRRLRVER